MRFRSWARFDGVQIGLCEQASGRAGVAQQISEQMPCRPPARRPGQPADEAAGPGGVHIAVGIAPRHGDAVHDEPVVCAVGRGGLRQHRAQDLGDRAACR
jgi:hypothetical protein